MLLLGISKAQFLTLSCFYPRSEGGRSRWVILGCAGRGPPLLPGFGWAVWAPSCCGFQLPGEAEGAASASLPRGRAGGSRGWPRRKVSMRWGQGNEGTWGKQQEKCLWARACALGCEQTDGLGLHLVLPFACLMAQQWRQGGFTHAGMQPEEKRSMIQPPWLGERSPWARDERKGKLV